MSTEIIDYGGDVSYWRKKAQQLEKDCKEMMAAAKSNALSCVEKQDTIIKLKKDCARLERNNEFLKTCVETLGKDRAYETQQKEEARKLAEEWRDTCCNNREHYPLPWEVEK